MCVCGVCVCVCGVCVCVVCVLCVCVCVVCVCVTSCSWALVVHHAVRVELKSNTRNTSQHPQTQTSTHHSLPGLGRLAALATHHCSCTRPHVPRVLTIHTFDVHTPHAAAVCMAGRKPLEHTLGEACTSANRDIPILGEHAPQSRVPQSQSHLHC